MSLSYNDVMVGILFNLPVERMFFRHDKKKFDAFVHKHRGLIGSLVGEKVQMNYGGPIPTSPRMREASEAVRANLLNFSSDGRYFVERLTLIPVYQEVLGKINSERGDEEALRILAGRYEEEVFSN